MEKKFTDIYETKFWGDNKSEEYSGSSGPGSSVLFNKKTYIPVLEGFIKRNNIKKVVDLGCGDFRCGYAYSDLKIKYVGYDVYKKVVDYNSKKYSSSKFKNKYKFIHMDFYNQMEDIESGDLCILKDVLQHWPIENIYTFLDYLVSSKKFKYILICNCSNQEDDYIIKNHYLRKWFCCYKFEDSSKIGGWKQLSCKYYPLRKYKAKKLYEFNTKEVSVIDV